MNRHDIHDITQDQWDRYLAGDASPDEDRVIEQWLAGHAGLPQLGDPPSPRAQDALSRVLARERVRQGDTRQRNRSQYQRSNVRRWIGAGAVAVLAGLAVWKTAGVPISRPAADAATMIVQETGPGERATLQLDDGSRVILGVASKIQYSPDFGTGNRDIYLDGEALFTVTHSGRSPFVVHTGEQKTTVLGTTFSVRRYATDAALRVVVAEGKVGVGETVVTTGEIASIGATTSIERGADIASAIAWSTGRLVLTDVSLRDAIPEFERWYGFALHADPALMQRSVTITLDRESLTEAIALLETVLHAKAERAGSQVTLYPR